MRRSKTAPSVWKRLLLYLMLLRFCEISGKENKLMTEHEALST